MKKVVMFTLADISGPFVQNDEGALRQALWVIKRFTMLETAGLKFHNNDREVHERTFFVPDNGRIQ